MRVSCPQCGTEQQDPTGTGPVRCRRCSTAFDRAPSGADLSAGVAGGDGALGAGPLAQDLFGDLEDSKGRALAVEVENDADPLLERGRQGSVGTSKIRSQSGYVATIPRADEDEDEEPTGWLVRTSDEKIHRFKDLESVRAWLGANPDLEVSLSSDGAHWRPPEAILAMDTSAVALSGDSGPVGPPLPGAAGTTTALRASANDAEVEGAGWWGGLAVASTLLLAATAGVTAHNFGVVDLGEVAPLVRLGILRPAPPTESAEATLPAPTAEQTAEELHRQALDRARRAQRRQDYVEAVLAYRRALSYVENDETLEGLAEAYLRLGDRERAEAARDRLKKLRAETRADDEGKGR